MLCQALGIRADTVDDNIFQWNVKFCNFAGTPLHDDLKLIEKRFGYHYIELQLDFSKVENFKDNYHLSMAPNQIKTAPESYFKKCLSQKYLLLTIKN